MSVSHMQCKHGRSEGGRVCLFQLNLSRWGRWGLQLLQKPIRLSRKIWITPSQHHDMEHFYFSIDFHHSMFYWIRKAKLKLRKRNIFDSHQGVLISLCSGSSQIGHPLLPYLGLIHIQAYSQPYLDKIQISSGACATADALINKSYFSFLQSLTMQPMLKSRKQSFSLV